VHLLRKLLHMWISGIHRYHRGGPVNTEVDFSIMGNIDIAQEANITGVQSLCFRAHCIPATHNYGGRPIGEPDVGSRSKCVDDFDNLVIRSALRKL
jgi:hypothetical protein